MNWLRFEPAAVGGVAAALYAAGAMLWRAYKGEGVLDLDVLVAACTAVWAFYTRMRVTPLARPQDADGRALRPSQQ